MKKAILICVKNCKLTQKNDLARKCIILKVPDTVFWLISTLSIAFLRKYLNQF